MIRMLEDLLVWMREKIPLDDKGSDVPVYQYRGSGGDTGRNRLSIRRSWNFVIQMLMDTKTRVFPEFRGTLIQVVKATISTAICYSDEESFTIMESVGRKGLKMDTKCSASVWPAMS